HALDVEDAVARVDVAAPDAGGVVDEVGARFLERFLPARRALRVLAIDPCIEAVDQLLVGDGSFRYGNADTADDDAFHDPVPNMRRYARQGRRPARQLELCRLPLRQINRGG